MNYKFAMSATNQFYLCPIENVVNKSQKNKINQQLLDACKSGNFQKVRELIECHGADLHLAPMEKCLTFNPEGNNPLHIAATKGYNDIVEYLINHNTNINCLNKRQAAPIHCAVFKGRTETVSRIIDKGASIEAKEDEGDTPLAWASYTGYSDIVELLIKRGANIHHRNNSNYTPLHWACYIGHLNVVKKLVEHGANIFTENIHGETPIDCASNCGRDDVYLYLLKISDKSKIFRVINGGKE